MGDLSFGEIVVVALVIIILFGPNKIPEIARGLGQGVRKMRGAVDEIKQEIMKEADNPLAEIKKEIEKVKAQVDELNPVNEVKKQFNDITSLDEDLKKTTAEKLEDTHEGPVSR